MGRPVHADGRQTRQAILDAALDLFADRGYFGTSLRDIAAVVGVRESAIYNYFKGKDALLIALLAAVHEQKTEQVEGVIADFGGDVRSVLEYFASLTLEDFSLTRQQRLFRVLMSDGMRLAKEGRIDLLERMLSHRTHLPGVMRRFMAAGTLRKGNPELYAIEFMGPLLLWRHWHAVVPNKPLIANRRAFVRHHVDHFLRGAESPATVDTQPRRGVRNAAVSKRARGSARRASSVS